MFSMVKCGKNENGFTIIELLVVIIVIAILAAIIIITYPKVISRSNESVIKAELDRVAKVLEIYKVDHGIYPSKKLCPITDDTQLCIEKSSNIDKLSYVSFNKNRSYYIKADKGDKSFIRGSNNNIFESQVAPKSGKDIVIIQPDKITPFKLITGSVEESDYFDEIYINPKPPEPTADLLSYIRIKGSGNYYNVITNVSEKYVLIAAVTLPDWVINATAYFYCKNDILFDNFGIDSFNLKAGWNKVVIQTNEVLSNSQISDAELPPPFQGQFYFNTGHDYTGNIESEAGKYVNTVPYFYEFE